MKQSNAFGSLLNAGASPRTGNPNARAMRPATPPVQRQAMQQEPAAPKMLNNLQSQLSAAAPPQSPQMQAQKALAQATPRMPSSPQQDMQLMQNQRQMPAPQAADPRQMAASQAQDALTKTRAMDGTAAPVGMGQQMQYMADQRMRESAPPMYAPNDGADRVQALSQQQTMPQPQEQQIATMLSPRLNAPARFDDMDAASMDLLKARLSAGMQDGTNQPDDSRSRMLAQLAAQRNSAQSYGR